MGMVPVALSIKLCASYYVMFLEVNTCRVLCVELICRLRRSYEHCTNHSKYR
jgi:hypothetical protein